MDILASGTSAAGITTMDRESVFYIFEHLLVEFTRTDKAALLRLFVVRIKCGSREMWLQPAGNWNN